MLDVRPQRISFERLPPRVKRAVEAILNHRRDIRRNILRLSPIPIGAGIGAHKLLEYLADKAESHTVETALAGASVAALIGFSAYTPHFRKFREEYLELANALKRTKKENRTGIFLRNPQAKYLIVESDGSIEMRRFNPKVGIPFVASIPIGRRRVGNPLHKTFSKWRKQERIVHPTNFQKKRVRR